MRYASPALVAAVIVVVVAVRPSVPRWTRVSDDLNRNRTRNQVRVNNARTSACKSNDVLRSWTRLRQSIERFTTVRREKQFS